MTVDPPGPRVTATVREAARGLARVPGDLLFLVLGTLSGGWVLLLVVAVVASRSGSILVLLLVVAASVRALMPAERLRLRLVGLRIPRPPRRPRAHGAARLVRFVVGDLDGRQGRYLLLLGPVGAACGVVCLAVWTTGVLGIIDGDWGRATSFGRFDPGAPRAETRLVATLVVVPLAVVTTRFLAGAQARLAADRLIGPGRRRIDEVLSSRARVVDAQTAELRRIERDLHDGAQARIVALTMQLGLLGRALRPLGADAAPARDRLAAATDTAQAALADLRHLVRGIYPPILGDRGLAAALSALAADLAIPVDLDAYTGERLAPAVEAAAYFTVAEALANAAKHAAASRCHVTVERDDDLLRFAVLDDGRGGADPGGPGLLGLRHRLEALDGHLTVSSPAGGPTTVRGELPCG